VLEILFHEQAHILPYSNHDIIGLTFEPDVQNVSPRQGRIRGRSFMLTQEERLTIVEDDLKKFKVDTVNVYQEVAMEFAITKGLTQDAVKRLMIAQNTLNGHTERLDRVEACPA